MSPLELWQAVDPAIRLDPNDYLDWRKVRNLTQQVHGDKATWWTQATPGVNYYRAWMPAKHLPGRAVSLMENDITPNHRFPRQAGAAVWMFPGNVTRWLLMAEMHNQGIPVWVEVDDNYTVPSKTAVTSSWLTSRDKTGGDRSSLECHQVIVKSKAVTGVICSTPKLAEVYSKLHRNVHVCRNSIDPDDWPEGDPPHQEDGILRVGWAGSASHGYDLADIGRALDWASRQANVEIVLFGQLYLSLKHRNIPWTDDLAEYRRNVSQIDVMLCPLRENLWSACKSDIKALEAAAGGAVSVVSKTEPFRPWWEDGAPCYVAEDDKGFLKAVKHIIANRDETRQMAEAAREYVLAERNIATEIEKWREALCP